MSGLEGQFTSLRIALCALQAQALVLTGQLAAMLRQTEALQEQLRLIQEGYGAAAQQSVPLLSAAFAPGPSAPLGAAAHPAGDDGSASDVLRRWLSGLPQGFRFPGVAAHLEASGIVTPPVAGGAPVEGEEEVEEVEALTPTDPEDEAALATHEWSTGAAAHSEVGDAGGDVFVATEGGVAEGPSLVAPWGMPDGEADEADGADAMWASAADDAEAVAAAEEALRVVAHASEQPGWDAGWGGVRWSWGGWV